MTFLIFNTKTRATLNLMIANFESSSGQCHAGQLYCAHILIFFSISARHNSLAFDLQVNIAYAPVDQDSLRWSILLA